MRFLKYIIAEPSINQLSWQVGSLAEVVDGAEYLRTNGVRIDRIGRDMPGSNWHVYFRDPDNHLSELYYGMEQIGWDRASKPAALYHRGYRDKPFSLPQISEESEIISAIGEGLDLNKSLHPSSKLAADHDVEGVLLPRPFKVTGHGPVSLYVADVAVSERFYVELLGFSLTEQVIFEGHRCVFLRLGSEHHSLALIPLALKERLGSTARHSAMSIGVKVANYKQLRAAIDFLVGRGWQRRLDVPAALYPGTDYAAHFMDSDGHCIQLYHYMERIGWDGRPRPSWQAPSADYWPETIDAKSDVYADQQYMGPLG